MMTAIGMGLIGAGVLVIYAGVTGQNIADELRAAFGGGGKGTAPPTAGSSGKSGLGGKGQAGEGGGGGGGGSW